MKYQIELVNRISVGVEAETAIEALKTLYPNHTQDGISYCDTNDPVNICDGCMKDIDDENYHYDYNDNNYYCRQCTDEENSIQKTEE
jgi:hypothetical protein